MQTFYLIYYCIFLSSFDTLEKSKVWIINFYKIDKFVKLFANGLLKHDKEF